jgi:UDP-3-O-[3-hydroxymyristoyl] glucosamine N-acyltransferase
VTIGSQCMIGGGVGFVGHIEIGDHVTISGFTFVTKSITEPGIYTSGMPVMPHADWLRNASLLRQLHRRLGRSAAAPKGEHRDGNDDD